MYKMDTIDRTISEHLCYYDKRNPNYSIELDDDEDYKKEIPCYCDNCFHGVTDLALRLLEKTNELKRLLII